MTSNIFYSQLTWDDAMVSQTSGEDTPSWHDFKCNLLARLGDRHFLLIKYRQCFGDVCNHQWETLTFYDNKHAPKAHNIDRLTRATTISARQAREILRQMKGANKEIWQYRSPHGIVYDINPPKGSHINPEAERIN